MSPGAWLDLDEGIADEFGEVQRLSPFAFDRDELRGFCVVCVGVEESAEAPCLPRESEEAVRVRVNERRRARRSEKADTERPKEARKALRSHHKRKYERREEAGQAPLVMAADESGERLTSCASAKGEGSDMKRAS